MFNPVEIPAAVRGNGGCSKLMQISILNQNTDNCDIDLIFMQKSTNLGTINDAPDISDSNAEAANMLGIWRLDGSVVSASLGGARLSTLHAVSAQANQAPLLLQAEDNSTSVYVAGILRDTTPTFAADDIDIILHIQYK